MRRFAVTIAALAANRRCGLLQQQFFKHGFKPGFKPG